MKIIGKFAGIIVVITIIGLLSGCQTGGISVWDASHPEDDTAVVQFNGVNVKSYNGISVSKFYHVRIPAGQTEISGDVTVFHAGMTFYLKEMSFKFNFSAGNEYKVWGTAQNALWGISISQNGEDAVFKPFIEQPKF